MIDQIVRLSQRAPIRIEKLCERLGLSDKQLRGWVDLARAEGMVVDVREGFVLTKQKLGAFNSVTIGNKKPGRYHVAIMTDVHFGSTHCDIEAVGEFLSVARKRGCTAVVCTGDLLDGNKSVLIQDQRATQFDSQSKEAVETIRKHGKGLKFVAIDGNHDGYFSASAGFTSGQVVEARMKSAYIDWTFAGVCLGRATIHGARWHLWHPHGGASSRNAVRRILNERVEALQEPCDILAMGHLHKFVSLPVYPENVLAVAGGCFQRKLSEFANRIAKPWDVGGTIVSYTMTRQGECTERSAEFVAL